MRNTLWKITSTRYPVGLSSGECSSQVVGACYVTIVVRDQKYENIKLSVMRNLVADVIVGEKFIIQHHSIIFEFGERSLF